MKNAQTSTVVIMILSTLLTIPAFAQSDTQEEVTVDAQQEFDIILPSNPSTGYQWMVKDISDESVVKYLNSTFVSSGSEMPGSGGTEVLTFWAEKEGTATITLQYLRSWEPDQPAETRIISVTVAGGQIDTMPGPLYLNGQSGPEGKYNVTVLWFSNDIGQNNTFSIRVYDMETSEEVYENLTLNFSIIQDGEELMSTELTGPAMPNSESAQFAYGQAFAFPSEGSYVVKLSSINGSEESVEFPVQVTPEFPSFMILIVVVAFASIIAAGAISKKRLV